MKKIFLIIIFASFIFGGCRKKTEDVSSIEKVSYPTITLNGNAFESHSVSTGTYTDAGATGTNDLSGATSNLTPIANDVDLTKEGFYTVVYTVKNDNGFVTNSTRFVLVTSANAAIDYSGLWQRNADPTRPANMTKFGTGLYLIDNVGGFILPDQGPAEPAYIGFLNDSTIAIPGQINSNGTFLSGEDGVFYIDNSVTPADTVMQWKMTAGPFAANTRVFHKAH